MIWTLGQIIPNDALRISVADRTFEHGLGLFETLRTWNGQAPLLERHLARLRASADALGLPLTQEQLPTSQSVRALLDSADAPRRRGDDARIRVTLSGGLFTGPAPGSVLWMTVGPLPEPDRPGGAIVASWIEVASDDVLARHKTLNYWRKRIEHSRAVAHGADEVLIATPDGLVHEASRSNLFVVAGHRLITPDLGGPLLPGIMRALVLEQATRIKIDTEETRLPLDRLASVDEAFLTSSVRGILPIAQLIGRDLPAPGPITRTLGQEIRNWLATGGAP